MIRLVQPYFAVLIGAALTLYGLHHVIAHMPPQTVMTAFWAAMPAVGAVLLFLLGLLALAAGLFILTTGILSVRRRHRQVRRIFGHPDMGEDPDEPGHHHQAYRYG